jgi:hypothetical protein
LISGERGTGKTTLLLSLTETLATNGEARPPSRLHLPDDLINVVTRLRRRLAWLETLDMEPLSDTANLLGAVLARIEDAVGAHFPDTDEFPTRTSLLYPGHDYHNSQREMMRLQTSVALAFDGNLSQRAGSLDPDNFANEARRAERERLGINRRFMSVLAALSRVLDGTSETESPVFVLPVDDLDLNPGACLLLLELLRKVHSPHLMVIIAANHRLLSSILELKYAGEFAAIAAPLPLSSDGDLDGRGRLADIQREANDLAANALRKHLPPTQRVILGLVEPTQALALKVHQTGPPMHELLGKVELAQDLTQLVSADTFGLSTPHNPADSGGPAELVGQTVVPSLFDAASSSCSDARYSWLEVLRLPMRTLIDICLAGATRPPHQQDTNQLRVLAHEQMDAFREYHSQLSGYYPSTSCAKQAGATGRSTGARQNVHPKPHLPWLGRAPAQRTTCQRRCADLHWFDRPA